MENDYRAELIKSHEYNFSEESNSPLKKILLDENHPISYAYILHWTPDQAEDFYTILINANYLVMLEVNRQDKTVVGAIERQELKAYLKGRSRTEQVQLLVAIDLTNEKT